MTPATILAPGRNCWAVADARHAGLLVDGRAYFRAFYEAARRARDSIVIAGWRFNSDTRLLRGRDAEAAGGEVQFLPFLAGLVKANPGLKIYVLAWDFSVNYAREWELFQERKFREAGDGRIEFRFDSAHAVGASHHQKFVVIDGDVAFVGGLDFNADVWDVRAHPAECADRCDSGLPPHGPYHDIQAYVTGPAAAELADYFCRRWRESGGEPIALPPPRGEPAVAFKPSIRLPAGPVALSEIDARTMTEHEPAYSIRQLCCDAIAAADELIYIENQYFSSQAVYDALLRRMDERGRPKPEIVFVLPLRLHSWVEAAAVGGPQLTMLEGLRDAARRTGHRLGIYAPVVTGADGHEEPVTVHSKLMAVDDRFLTAGSANTSNRSMGLDTELNLAWEAGDARAARAIRRARVELLAEHCGRRRDRELRAALGRTRGLVDYLDGLAAPGKCRLRPVTREVLLKDREWLERLAELGFAFDPERSLEETLYETVIGPGVEWVRERLVGSDDGRINDSTSSDTSGPGVGTPG